MRRLTAKWLMMRRNPAIDTSIFLEGQLILRAYRADTFFSRMLGLHALPELLPGQCLVIRPCHAVHTFGLSFPIDVLFLSPAGRVMKAVSVSPGRTAVCCGASQVIEAVAGTIQEFQLQEGKVLSFSSDRAVSGPRARFLPAVH